MSSWCFIQAFAVALQSYLNNKLFSRPLSLWSLLEYRQQTEASPSLGNKSWLLLMHGRWQGRFDRKPPTVVHNCESGLLWWQINNKPPPPHVRVSLTTRWCWCDDNAVTHHVCDIKRYLDAGVAGLRLGLDADVRPAVLSPIPVRVVARMPALVGDDGGDGIGRIGFDEEAV